MVHIQSMKQVKVLAHLQWLCEVDSKAIELPSPTFPVRILDLEWASNRKLVVCFHDDRSSASHLILTPNQTRYRLDLNSVDLEISPQTRFYVISTDEEANPRDYLLITYIG